MDLAALAMLRRRQIKLHILECHRALIVMAVVLVVAGMVA